MKTGHYFVCGALFIGLGYTSVTKNLWNCKDPHTPDLRPKIKMVQGKEIAYRISGDIYSGSIRLVKTEK